VHGFLTVDGEKMSKRRRTFIMASTYAKHLDPDYLRYYFAAKLGPGADDLDLNFDDFVAKVNSDLVGKLVNIASRCAGFVHKLNGGQLAAHLPADKLLDEFRAEADTIARDYENRDFARAMRRIMALADRANRYIDERKPWQMAKQPEQHAEVVAVCTLGINLFRALTALLKPVVPALAERAERFLACEPLTWSDIGEPLLGQRIENYQALLNRVDNASIEKIAAETKGRQAPVDSKPDDSTEIDIEQFAKIDLRVARIVAAHHVDGAEKLLKLELDLGTEQRIVFAGIRSAYEPASLEGKHVVVVANLKSRKMRFGTSQGMVLAAGPGGEEIFLLSPDDGAKPGMQVR
jgi:methionyl-tRNA synthetase